MGFCKKIMFGRSKRLFAGILACMLTLSTTSIGLTVSAASTQKATSSVAATTYTKSDKAYWNKKAADVQKLKAFKNGTYSYKLYRIALSQVGNSGSTMTLYGGTGADSSAAYFISWCINKAQLKTKLCSGQANGLISPVDQAIKAKYVTFTKAANSRLSEDWIASYAKKAAKKNADATKIAYKVGDIVYFGMKRDSKSYYFANCGIVTAVNTYGNVTYLSYISSGYTETQEVQKRVIKLDKNVNSGSYVIMAHVAVSKVK